MEKKAFELNDVIHDLDEEQKHKRYIELLGKQKNDVELSLHSITSHYYVHLYDSKSKLFTIPYIKIGEPCMICLEPILNRKNAYCTECGHKIHKTCITDYYNSTYNNKRNGHKHNWKINCPICRSSLVKCLWLEKNCLDYQEYQHLYNHRIVECSQCGELCGLNYNMGCDECFKWRYFRVSDLKKYNEQQKCIIWIYFSKLWYSLKKCLLFSSDGDNEYL